MLGNVMEFLWGAILKNPRKLLIGLTISIIGAIGFNYMHTFWRGAGAPKKPTLLLDAEIIRSADGIEYSENENGVLRFRLHAEKMSETRQGPSIFYGIEASDVNPDGSTRNRIRSPKARYSRDTKKVLFFEGVRIQMSHGLEVRTNSLGFNIKGGTWETDDRVEIFFQQIGGTTRGLRYDPDTNSLFFKSNVDFLFPWDVRSRKGILRGERTRAQSSEGYYSQETQVFGWKGNARLSSGKEILAADEIRMRFRAAGTQIALQRLNAEGSVKWASDPEIKDPENEASAGRTIMAGALQISYGNASGSQENGQATGTVVLTGMRIKGTGNVEMQRIKAETVRFGFYRGTNIMKSLDAEGNVLAAFSRPRDPAEASPAEESRTSSRRMRVVFQQSDGAIETVSQWGEFVYQDGQRIATSGRSDYSAEKDLLVLNESPKIRDTNGSTTGDLISFYGKLHILTVQGHVRSVLGANENRNNIPFLFSSDEELNPATPAVVTSDEMECWTDSAHIRYRGNVELLHEGSQLSAQKLEILNSGKRIDAEGDIRHLIRRYDAAQYRVRNKPMMLPSAVMQKPGEPIMIRSAILQLNKSENSGRYSGNVLLKSNNLEISSENMNIGFESRDRQIEKVSARGSVRVRQGNREALGLLGDYDAALGKITVTGELAEIRDPQRGRMTARRITFSSADDKILLEDK